jgi:hypothetical protein
MAGLRIPVELSGVEFRGVAAPFEFPDRETGEVVSVGPKLKFELELPDGDVALLPVPSSQLEKCSPPVDYTTLKRGQRFVALLEVVWKGAEPKGESYVRVTSLVREEARIRPAADKDRAAAA